MSPKYTKSPRRRRRRFGASGYSANPKGRVTLSKNRPTGRRRRPDQRGMAERRRRSRTRLRGFSPASDVSRRNFSAQATSGRNSNDVQADHHGNHHGRSPRTTFEIDPCCDCRADIAPHTGEGVGVRAHGDGLREGQEEPATSHAHHGVPDETDHRARHIELPEALPLRQAVHARRFVEIAGLRDERVVEAEGHVPGLGREHGEDGGELQSEERAFEQAHEQDDGEGEEPEDGNRLQDVEQGNQHLLRSPQPGGCRGEHEGEDRRDRQRCQHPE